MKFKVTKWNEIYQWWKFVGGRHILILRHAILVMFHITLLSRENLLQYVSSTAIYIDTLILVFTRVPSCVIISEDASQLTSCMQ